MDAAKEPGIRIAQIFTERAQLSHREDFLAIAGPVQVGDVDIAFEVGVSADKKRGLVRARASSRAENKPTYNFEVTVTALVEASDEPNLTVDEYVAKYGPVMIFPFLRQAVADLTGRGRFGPIWIRPTNLTRDTHQLTVAGAGPQHAGEAPSGS